MIDVLVLSHDEHCDNWPGFHYWWKDHFKADQASVAFISGVQRPSFRDDAICERPLGKGGFVEILDKALHKLEGPIMLILGDMWLTTEISNGWLRGRLHMMRALRGRVLRIDPPAPYDVVTTGKDVDGHRVYNYKAHSPYLVSFQPTIYRDASAVMAGLDLRDSPWDAEIKGTRRLREQYPGRLTDLFLIDERIVCNTMRHGRWSDKDDVKQMRTEAGCT